MKDLSILCVMVMVLAAPLLWAIPFSTTKIIIETNATDGDAGIQISVDAAGWTLLEVFDPNGTKIFEVSASGSVGEQGVTELFFESEEPSLEEVPFTDLFTRFPAGNYSFVGTTVDGKKLSGKANLTHAIPAGPQILAPAEGASLGATSAVVIAWQPVSSAFPGTSAAVNVVAYQVIVERLKSQPAKVYSVVVPASVTQVTVPAEFFQSSGDYKFEILAIDIGGNQTISESSFKTGN